MRPEDYCDPVRFPLTTQSGLSLKEQFMIDSFNLDGLREAQEMDEELVDEQQGRLAELLKKEPHMKALLQELTVER
jgi:hypothetical protein